MDIELNDDDCRFRDEVREFLRENLSDDFCEGAFGTVVSFSEPDIGLKWQAVLHKRGWAGYTWPREVGGTGWTALQRFIFEHECAWAGAPIPPVIGTRLLGPVLFTFGTAEQKEYYLPRILSGEDYWCQGFSEPSAGSDLANLRTKAVRVGDEYIVNGTKLWTTQAQHANKIFCLVRTDPKVKPQAGISFLLLDMNQPAIAVTPIISIAGDHEVNQVFLTDARTSAENLVGAEGQGWTIAKFLLEHERGGTNFSSRLLADIARLRKPAPGRVDPAHAVEIDKLEIEAYALHALELRIVCDIMKGNKPGPMASVVKMLAANQRQKLDQLAMGGLGLDGFVLPRERPFYGREFAKSGINREAHVAAAKYLNGRAWTVFGGSDEIQKTIIAGAVLGL